MRERFQAGLVADVHPPDFPTRLAILRKRAQHDHVDLAGEGTLELIAERVPVNVRALEGVLIRVVAYGSLTGKALTPELASEVLDGLYRTGSPRLGARPSSVGEIQAAASEQFGISTEEPLEPRASKVTWPRQVAMYLAESLHPSRFHRSGANSEDAITQPSCTPGDAQLNECKPTTPRWRLCRTSAASSRASPHDRSG